MNRLGKYWGEDPFASMYQISQTLGEFYFDITYVDLIINLSLDGSIPITLQEALDWSVEKIGLVGIEGLNEPEIRILSEYGLI